MIVRWSLQPAGAENFNCDLALGAMSWPSWTNFSLFAVTNKKRLLYNVKRIRIGWS
jgi:hypothetical protein